MKKKIADKIKDYIDWAVEEGYSPLGYTERDMERYLRGVVNGVWFWSYDLGMAERDDILENHLPAALEWFRMRREVEERRWA